MRRPPERGITIRWKWTHQRYGPWRGRLLLSLSLISRVYLYLPSCNGSCRLIELSSFQFDAEISPESPDEKSWWLNIEKHARPLSGLARQLGGPCYLWVLLFVVAFLYSHTQMLNKVRVRDFLNGGINFFILFISISQKYKLWILSPQCVDDKRMIF